MHIRAVRVVLVILMSINIVYADDLVFSWINRVPKDMLPFTVRPELDARQYEVVASQVAKALIFLNHRAFVQLTREEAAELTGHYYSLPEGKTPYLVRAVFGNQNGGFHIWAVNQSLIVVHHSLGSFVPPSRTALVVNLEFEPKEIYVEVWIDE